MPTLEINENNQTTLTNGVHSTGEAVVNTEAAENIVDLPRVKEVKKLIKELSPSELPTIAAGDVNKYLKVGSDGELAWAEAGGRKLYFHSLNTTFWNYSGSIQMALITGDAEPYTIESIVAMIRGLPAGASFHSISPVIIPSISDTETGKFGFKVFVGSRLETNNRSELLVKGGNTPILRFTYDNTNNNFAGQVVSYAAVDQWTVRTITDVVNEMGA